MQYFFKTIFLLISLLIAITCYADAMPATKAFLQHCNTKGITTKGQQIILNVGNNNAQNNWVYVLQNTSNQTIYLDHPSDRPGTANAGWGSSIAAKQWSALMLNRPAFALTCKTSLINNQNNVVVCNKVLQVVRFKPRTLNKHLQGSFWLAEDKSLDKLLATFNARGVQWN